MRRLVGLFSGILDSGLAAIGNLAMGLFAVTTFAADGVALYSLFFSGWVVAQLLPAQLSYLPARLAVNSMPNIAAPHIALDVRRGVVAILAAPFLVTLAGLPLISTTTLGAYSLVAVGVGALTFIAPLQDHIRASLHIVGMHSSAALVSAVTAGVAVAGLAIAHFGAAGRSDDPAPWVPFGVLAIANMLGAAVGVLLLSRAERATYSLPGPATRLSYLGPNATSQSTGYLVNVLVAAALGTSTLAALETARVMASPVLVVVSGLATYLSPTTIRHFARGQIRKFRRRLLGMAGAVLILGATYSIALLVFARAAESAFGRHADASLGASRTLVTSIDTASVNSGSVLFVAGRPLAWNVIALICSALTLVTLLPFLHIAGAFGVPLAQGVGSAFKTGAGLSLAARAGPKHT